MLSLQSLLVVTAIAGAGETVLLHFTADNCVHCRNVAPIVSRLKNDAYPIRTIDVNRSAAWAQNYKVTGVPCFVMIANGQVVDRVDGATSSARLLRMFEFVPTRVLEARPPLRLVPITRTAHHVRHDEQRRAQTRIREHIQRVFHDAAVSIVERQHDRPRWRVPTTLDQVRRLVERQRRVALPHEPRDLLPKHGKRHRPTDVGGTLDGQHRVVGQDRNAHGAHGCTWVR